MTINDLTQIKDTEIAGRKKIVLRCCMAAGCLSLGSKEVKEQLEAAVTAAGLQNEVEVRCVGCLRLCCEGPLVAADLDRLPIVLMQHAGAFAQHIDWTHAGTAQAQYIGIENRQCRTAQIPARNLFDEARHVDPGRDDRRHLHR